MKKLKKEELKQINGGSGMSAAMLNAIIRGVSTLFAIGQAVGSAVRRTITGNYC